MHSRRNSDFKDVNFGLGFRQRDNEAAIHLKTERELPLRRILSQEKLGKALERSQFYVSKEENVISDKSKNGRVTDGKI